MIILDTNVVSEFIKRAADAKIQTWLDQQDIQDVFITAVTAAEMRYGLEILPAGKRKQKLATVIAGVLEIEFLNRILPFDSSAAVAYATIAASRRRAGRPISISDAQIAAIAKAQHASLATRNTADFQNAGLHLINPWTI